jgi:NAD(P)-dependent dehydrogenase (short-subunit alcohol dehydrogenase family)
MTQTIYAGLPGRVVLITGGASGIGAAFVRAFAAQQARVAFLDIDADAGEALVREVASECDAAPLFVPCDLLDIAALRAAMARVRAALGDAAALVNNAANDQRQVLSEVTPAEFDWMIGVNLRHVFFAAQAVIPQMQARGGGSIINMSSHGCAAHRRCRLTPRRRRRLSASPTPWLGWSDPTAFASTPSRPAW